MVTIIVRPLKGFWGQLNTVWGIDEIKQLSDKNISALFSESWKYMGSEWKTQCNTVFFVKLNFVTITYTRYQKKTVANPLKRFWRRLNTVWGGLKRSNSWLCASLSLCLWCRRDPGEQWLRRQRLKKSEPDFSKMIHKISWNAIIYWEDPEV